MCPNFARLWEQDVHWEVLQWIAWSFEALSCLAFFLNANHLDVSEAPGVTQTKTHGAILFHHPIGQTCMPWLDLK